MHIEVIQPEGTTDLPFSAATRAGGWVLPAGQAGVRDDGTVPESFTEEVELALRNLSDVLDAAGSDMAHILRVEVILRDMADFDEMNRVYRATFAEPRPARYTIGAALAPGLRVEFVATAVVRD